MSIPRLQDIRLSNYVSRPDTTAIDFDSWLSTLNNVLSQTDRANARSLQTQPTPRVLRRANLPGLRETGQRAAVLNQLETENLNREFNPIGERARKLVAERVFEDANETMPVFTGTIDEGPNRDLSNLWTQMGLEESIATGARSDSGFARSSLADSTRRSYINDRARLRAELAQDKREFENDFDRRRALRDSQTTSLDALSRANPRIQSGFDPAFAVARQAEIEDLNALNADQDRQDFDLFRQQQRANERTGIADMMGVIQSLMQASAAQKSEDIAAQRDYDQQRLDWDLYMAQLMQTAPTVRSSSGGSNAALTGALGGAATGAMTGMAAGPWGALIGAGVGALAGGLSSNATAGAATGQAASGGYNSYANSARQGGGNRMIGDALGNFQYYTGTTPRAIRA